MRFARFEDSICYQEIEVAANTGGSEAKALSQNYCGRGAIFENRARDSVAGAEVIDFHNSIVS
jgi:hypothetical protein